MADLLRVESVIEGVEVFRKEALIWRRAEVEASEGERDLLLVGLPAELDEGSLRISLPKSSARVIALQEEWESTVLKWNLATRRARR